MLTLLIVGVGAGGAVLGLRERRRQPDYHVNHPMDPSAVPLWIMIGPIHEGLEDLSDIAEQSRKTNANLSDIVRHVERYNLGQEYTHRLLEAMLRNLEPTDSASPIRKGITK